MRFLVAEDDVSSNRLFQIYLSELGECRSALDGAEALKLFEEAVNGGDPFDAVLLDVLMPQMDGVDVFSRVRSMEARLGLAPTPVVFLSALGEEDVLGAVEGDPLVAVVRKPVSRGTLKEALDRLLGSPGGS
ncbi:response regulator with CheY-like receiver domain and winged-helix DNA-binding domain [Thermanaerovibrio velox DSM 12556]|uniref:Response regulator with CheY-like receiver domain and winged-helix DNA-binding domain n=1 Tax=Thermanaerovibrio velox DSM 12556 TaxID=926567 RepID=H0UPT3_9BACT|nr:response regulator [Thermanaerovibrio velox]EHM10642.1 response regulator with CheY-like receiver domain and winged-helix DNA-binding domain [Thermanaerovibrio velox DSM 12556]